MAFDAVTARLFVWPDLPPIPPRVDAVVKLGGFGEPGRERLALDLVRAHRAPVLAVSTTIDEERTGRCLPPVADVTILCFHPVPNTTRGEARYIGRMARQHHWRSVILITTRDHAWRATLRVGRCFHGEIYVDTPTLPATRWPVAIPYQWGATLKAFTTERTC